MNIQTFNLWQLYAIVGIVIAAIVAMCLLFMYKSWCAGLKLGMEKTALKKVIFSSASFTLLPSLSILLGVIALSGTMGVPLPWLRLSVIGNLQYEVNVAQIAATGIGLSGLKASEMTAEAFVTIALVMTAGILGGVLLCIFTLKAYSQKLNGKKASSATADEIAQDTASTNETTQSTNESTQNTAATYEPTQDDLQDILASDPAPQSEAQAATSDANKATKRKNFGDWAMIAMFVGMCATYIGSYVGLTVQSDFLPLITALSAGAFMLVCEWFEREKKWGWLENFDLAASMLFAMAVAVLVNPML